MLQLYYMHNILFNIRRDRKEERMHEFSREFTTIYHVNNNGDDIWFFKGNYSDIFWNIQVGT